MTQTEERTPVTESAPLLAGVTPDRVAQPTVAASDQPSQYPAAGYDFTTAGLLMTTDHRYYFNGQGPWPSVTTVIGILDKPAVVQWKARETARAILKDPDTYVVSTDDPTYLSGLDERINAAVRSADSQRDTAAKLGTSVHLLANIVGASESAVDGFQLSEQEKPYVDAFRGFLAFLEAQGGTIVSSEHAVWNLNGYAGTYDLILSLRDQLWLIDIKTSKGYYPEYGLQLAAYRWGENIALPGDPRLYPMPEIQRTGVLHLRPDQYPDSGWRLIEYPTTERDYIAFLAALDLFNWKSEGRFQKSVLSPMPMG